MFNNLSFKTPIAEPRPRKRTADGIEIHQLNQASHNYNREHQKIRSRVEQPFARIKNLFEILKSPFSVCIEQLESLIVIGCGVMN